MNIASFLFLKLYMYVITFVAILNYVPCINYEVSTLILRKGNEKRTFYIDFTVNCHL